jgi:hypothetical protein
LLASFCLFWFSDTVADPDLWGHIRFGQDILRTGSLIQIDTYSYRTTGQPWINHEWLSEVIFASIHDRFGPQGLIVSKVMVSLLIIGLCYADLRRQGLSAVPAIILLALITIPFRMGLGTVRPQVFTYVLFYLQLVLLRQASAGRVAWLWLSPLLLAVWVNLHGGVLAGVGVLGLWTAVRIVSRSMVDRRRGNRSLVGVVQGILLGLACGSALLLNPYGAGLVGFLLRTATVPRPEIAEWMPLGWTSLPGLLDLVLLAIGIVGLVGSRRPRRPEAVAILGLTALLPMLASRHYPLFALALIILGGEHIADAANRWWPPARMRPGPRRGLAVTSLVLCLLLISQSLPRFRCIRIEPFYFPFPARAVAFLAQSGVRGNLAVPFDWGEYVLWHLGPGVKVSMDGRRETVYSEETYRQSRDFERGTGTWDALLKTGPSTDLVLTPNGSPTAVLMGRTAGWLALYQDSFCLIFVRSNFPGLGQLVATPVPVLPDHGGGLCFPAPAARSRDPIVRARPGSRSRPAPGD